MFGVDLDNALAWFVVRAVDLLVNPLFLILVACLLLMAIWNRKGKGPL